MTRFGYKMTKEHKRKISEGGKGRVVSPETRLKMSIVAKGRIKSPEWRKKIGDAQRGRKWTEERKTRLIAEGKIGRKGAEHPSWKGGRKNFLRNQAIVRDNYTCQVCSLRDPEIMQADHIKPRSQFPEMEFELDNLRTICPNCHERKSRKEHVDKSVKEFKWTGWVKPVNQSPSVTYAQM